MHYVNECPHKYSCTNVCVCVCVCEQQKKNDKNLPWFFLKYPDLNRLLQPLFYSVFFIPSLCAFIFFHSSLFSSSIHLFLPPFFIVLIFLYKRFSLLNYNPAVLFQQRSKQTVGYSWSLQQSSESLQAEKIKYVKSFRCPIKDEFINLQGRWEPRIWACVFLSEATVER